jgi:hypothetical protein
MASETGQGTVVLGVCGVMIAQSCCWERVLMIGRPVDEPRVGCNPWGTLALSRTTNAGGSGGGGGELTARCVLKWR